MPALERRLQPIRRKWNGVIPIWELARNGIRQDSFRRWAYSNPDVTRPLKGVYVWYADDENAELIDWTLTPISQLLAYTGSGAYLAGTTVLEYAGIGSVGGLKADIAVPTRRRRRADVDWIVTSQPARSNIKGLPAQTIPEALESGLRGLDTDKAGEAIADCVARGWLTIEDQRRLKARYAIV